MNNEERRLQSFLRSWPHSHYGFNPTPIKLAKSGFFHSPTPSFPDRVVCFCCGIALVHWNAHHDPWTEHVKRSPTCGLVTGSYASFLEEQKRIDTFHNWPLPPHFAATPTKLASAGFFQSATAQFTDRCVCFCCGITLVKWDASDDPWTEHLKYSKNCPFVRGKETGNIPIPQGPEESVTENSLKNLINQLIEAGLDPSLNAPSYFLCPITQDIFIEPVVAEDGHTYEKDAIKKWLENHNTSPLTNKMLYSKRLIPNHNLHAQMIEYAENLLNVHKKQQQQPLELSQHVVNNNNNNNNNNGEENFGTSASDYDLDHSPQSPMDQ